MSDIDLYLFIEKGLRGVISYIAKRYAKAKNEYMKDYNPKKPSKFMTYLDMNNLYGQAMSDYLPYGRFKWLKNVDRYNVNSKFAVSYEMLSKYCKKIADKYRIKVGDVQKLIPNLGNKTNYQLHYRNLQLYLFLGMKLTKIQRV